MPIIVGISATFGESPHSEPFTPERQQHSVEPSQTGGTGALASVRGGGIETLTPIHFDFGKASVTAESLPTIRAIAGVMFAHPNIDRMTIEGHADATGPEEFNHTLSRDRALAIKKLLIDIGVEPIRLEVKEQGEAQPVAPNQTETGRAANRRVEFIIELRGETRKEKSE